MYAQVSALNVLGTTSWKVNRRVLDVCCAAWATDELEVDWLPSRRDVPVPEYSAEHLQWLEDRPEGFVVADGERSEEEEEEEREQARVRREAYFPTYLLTYLLTYLPTYLPTYLLTYLPTYLPTYLLTYLPTHLLTSPRCSWSTWPPMSSCSNGWWRLATY